MSGVSCASPEWSLLQLRDSECKSWCLPLWLSSPSQEARCGHGDAAAFPTGSSVVPPGANVGAAEQRQGADIKLSAGRDLEGLSDADLGRIRGLLGALRRALEAVSTTEAPQKSAAHADTSEGADGGEGDKLMAEATAAAMASAWPGWLLDQLKILVEAAELLRRGFVPLVERWRCQALDLPGSVVSKCEVVRQWRFSSAGSRALMPAFFVQVQRA